jgi:branched-chain amino acid transport system substrate-binding protein
VRHVIGHYTSAPTASADEIYIRHRMLLIAPSATSPGLPVKPGSPFLRLAPREEAQGQFAGEWLAREFPVGTLIVVQDSAVLSRNIARAAASAIGKARREPAELRELPPASAEAPGQAASLAQAIARGNVAAVYFAANPGNAAPFLRALRSTGSHIPVIASDMLATPEFAAATGEAIDELRMVVTANAAENEQAREVASRLNSEGVRDLNLALSNYAAVQILAEAAKRSRGTDPDAMAKVMRDGAPTTTIIGTVSFDANGERRESPFMIVRWKRAADGKFLFAPD